MQETKDLFADELRHVNGHIDTITARITRLQGAWTEADKDERRDLSRCLGALASGLSSAFTRRGDMAEIIRTLEMPV